MRTFTAIIERCLNTGLGSPVRILKASLDELQRNLREVIDMLHEDGDPDLKTEFVGTQSIIIAA